MSPAEARTGFQSIAPHLANFVTRRQVDADEDFSAPDYHFLTGFARSPNGDLTGDAIAHYQGDAEAFLADGLSEVVARAGVTVVGIDDTMLAELIALNPRYLVKYPELATYLRRVDRAARTDGNTAFVVEEIAHEHDGERVRVRVHYSEDDPIAGPRRELVMRALSTLRGAGYTLPAALEVYLPRYHRALDVHLVADVNGEPALHIESMSVSAAIVDSDMGLFTAPNHMVMTTMSTVPRPADYVVDSNVFGLDDLMEDWALGGQLHELMHWLHYQSEPKSYVDLRFTEFQDHDLASVAAVSRYALTNPGEFVAEYGSGRLLGLHYADPAVAAWLEALYVGLGGPLPARETGPVAPPALSAEQSRSLVAAVHQMPGMSAIDEHRVVVADERLAPFDRWRNLSARAALIATSLAMPNSQTPARGGPVPGTGANRSDGASVGELARRTPGVDRPTSAAEMSRAARQLGSRDVRGNPTPLSGRTVEPVRLGQTSRAGGGPRRRLAELEAKYFFAPVGLGASHSMDTAVQTHVDGANYFGAIADVLDGLGAARDRLYITSFTFELETRLRPSVDEPTLSERLVRLARAGVDVRVVVAVPRHGVNQFDAPLFRRDVVHKMFNAGIGGIAQANLRAVLRLREELGAHGGRVLVDWGGGFDSRHEKSTVTYRASAKELSAFVGGMDYAAARRAEQRHAGNPHADSWHDVGVQLQGGAAESVLDNFWTRWVETVTLPERQFYASNGHEMAFNPAVQPMPQHLRPAWAKPPAARNTQGSVRVWRSYAENRVTPLADDERLAWHTLPPTGIVEIADGLKAAIGAASRYIYIEDQLLNPGLAAEIISQHRFLFPLLAQAADRGVKVIFVTQGSPGVGVPDGDATPFLSTEIQKSVLEKISPSRQANFAGFYLADTKVHSKLVMIDDEFVSIGSANTWDRSFTGDESELNVAFVDGGGSASQVADLRIRLWREHFRMPENQASDLTLRNLDVALGLFDNRWGQGRSSQARDSVLRRLQPASAVTPFWLPQEWANWRNGDEREIAAHIAARSAGTNQVMDLASRGDARPAGVGEVSETAARRVYDARSAPQPAAQTRPGDTPGLQAQGGQGAQRDRVDQGGDTIPSVRGGAGRGAGGGGRGDHGLDSADEPRLGLVEPSESGARSETSGIDRSESSHGRDMSGPADVAVASTFVARDTPGLASSDEMPLAVVQGVPGSSTQGVQPLSTPPVIRRGDPTAGTAASSTERALAPFDRWRNLTDRAMKIAETLNPTTTPAPANTSQGASRAPADPRTSLSPPPEGAAPATDGAGVPATRAAQTAAGTGGAVVGQRAAAPRASTVVQGGPAVDVGSLAAPAAAAAVLTPRPDPPPSVIHRVPSEDSAVSQSGVAGGSALRSGRVAGPGNQGGRGSGIAPVPADQAPGFFVGGDGLDPQEFFALLEGDPGLGPPVARVGGADHHDGVADPRLSTLPHSDSTLDDVHQWIGDVNNDGDQSVKPRDDRLLNCGPVTVAVFHRLSGIPSNARAHKDVFSVDDLVTATGLGVVPASAGRIAQRLVAEGSGAHTIAVARFEGGQQHAFNVFVDGTTVHALDGQHGRVQSWPPALDLPGNAVREWFMGVPSPVERSVSVRSDGLTPAGAGAADRDLSLGAGRQPAIPQPSIVTGSEGDVEESGAPNRPPGPDTAPPDAGAEDVAPVDDLSKDEAPRNAAPADSSGAAQDGSGQASTDVGLSGDPVHSSDMVDARGNPILIPETAQQGARSQHLPVFTTDRPSAQIRPEVDAANIEIGYENPTGIVHFRTDGHLLFREDTRAPGEIFRKGFRPRNRLMTNLSRMAADTPSAFVSTSRNPNLYHLGHSMPGTPVYRYVIDAPAGVDVTGTFGQSYGGDHEHGIAFPGGIRTQNIVGAQKVLSVPTPAQTFRDEGMAVRGEFIPNANYQPEEPNSRFPAAQPPPFTVGAAVRTDVASEVQPPRAGVGLDAGNQAMTEGELHLGTVQDQPQNDARPDGIGTQHDGPIDRATETGVVPSAAERPTTRIPPSSIVGGLPPHDANVPAPSAPGEELLAPSTDVEGVVVGPPRDVAPVGLSDAELDHEYGRLIEPKRIKDQELLEVASDSVEPIQQLRVNPALFRLSDMPAGVLLSHKEAKWHYSVDAEGHIRVGSEELGSLLPDDELAEMYGHHRGGPADRSVSEVQDPSVEELQQFREFINGQGHPTIAVEFDHEGRVANNKPQSRVSGEIGWNADEGRWEVNDKSGRYMSKKVRSPAPDDVERWTANVARRLASHLGVPVTPLVIKTAESKTAAPKPAPEPPRDDPAKEGGIRDAAPADVPLDQPAEDDAPRDAAGKDEPPLEAPVDDPAKDAPPGSLGAKKQLSRDAPAASRAESRPGASPVDRASWAVVSTTADGSTPRSPKGADPEGTGPENVADSGMTARGTRGTGSGARGTRAGGSGAGGTGTGAGGSGGRGSGSGTGAGGSGGRGSGTGGRGTGVGGGGVGSSREVAPGASSSPAVGAAPSVTHNGSAARGATRSASTGAGADGDASSTRPDTPSTGNGLRVTANGSEQPSDAAQPNARPGGATSSDRGATPTASSDRGVTPTATSTASASTATSTASSVSASSGTPSARQGIPSAGQSSAVGGAPPVVAGAPGSRGPASTAQTSPADPTTGSAVSNTADGVSGGNRAAPVSTGGAAAQGSARTAVSAGAAAEGAAAEGAVSEGAQRVSAGPQTSLSRAAVGAAPQWQIYAPLQVLAAAGITPESTDIPLASTPHTPGTPDPASASASASASAPPSGSDTASDTAHRVAHQPGGGSSTVTTQAGHVPPAETSSQPSSSRRSDHLDDRDDSGDADQSGPAAAHQQQGPGSAATGISAVVGVSGAEAQELWLARYQTMAPALKDIAVRRRLDPSMSQTGRDQYRFLTDPDDDGLPAEPRDSDGQLSQAAISTLTANTTEAFFDSTDAIQEEAGIFVDDGIDLSHDIGRPDLMSRFPELETFRQRQNVDGLGAHANPTLNRTLSLHQTGVSISYERDQHDPTATARERLVAQALTLLDAAGYELGPDLEVFLPVYDRLLEVNTVTGSDGHTTLDVVPHKIPGSVFPNTTALFMPPHHLYLSPRALLLPPGASAAAATPVPVAVAYLMPHPALGQVLHELMHWLHFLNAPKRFVDVYVTEFAQQADAGHAGMISRYASTALHELVAEKAVSNLLGRGVDDPVAAARLDEIFTALGGPTPLRGAPPVSAPAGQASPPQHHLTPSPAATTPARTPAGSASSTPAESPATGRSSTTDDPHEAAWYAPGEDTPSLHQPAVPEGVVQTSTPSPGSVASPSAPGSSGPNEATAVPPTSGADAGGHHAGSAGPAVPVMLLREVAPAWLQQSTSLIAQDPADMGPGVLRDAAVVITPDGTLGMALVTTPGETVDVSLAMPLDISEQDLHDLGVHDTAPGVVSQAALALTPQMTMVLVKLPPEVAVSVGPVSVGPVSQSTVGHDTDGEASQSERSDGQRHGGSRIDKDKKVATLDEQHRRPTDPDDSPPAPTTSAAPTTWAAPTAPAAAGAPLSSAPHHHGTTGPFSPGTTTGGPSSPGPTAAGLSVTGTADTAARPIPGGVATVSRAAPSRSAAGAVFGRGAQARSESGSSERGAHRSTNIVAAGHDPGMTAPTGLSAAASTGVAAAPPAAAATLTERTATDLGIGRDAAPEAGLPVTRRVDGPPDAGVDIAAGSALPAPGAPGAWSESPGSVPTRLTPLARPSVERPAPMPLAPLPSLLSLPSASAPAASLSSGTPSRPVAERPPPRPVQELLQLPGVGARHVAMGTLPEAPNSGDATEAAVVFPRATTSVAEIRTWLPHVNLLADMGGLPDRARRDNCGQTTLSVYDRLLGRATFQGAGYGSMSEFGMDEAAGTVQFSSSSSQDISLALRGGGSGAHAPICVVRSDGSKHLFNAYFDGTTVYAVDGQTARISEWPPNYDLPSAPVVEWIVHVPSGETREFIPAQEWDVPHAGAHGEEIEEIAAVLAPARSSA